MNSTAAALWRFITLPEYRVPPWPARTGFRLRVNDFLGSLRSRRTSSGPAVDPMMLERISDAQMGGLVSQQDPTALAEGMTSILGTWPTGGREGQPVKVFVHAAHCDAPEALRRWADENAWEVLDPPERAAIIETGASWVERLHKRDDADTVIPRLDAFFLRHADGFDLLRALLNWLLSRPGRTLLACNSWAWAFLSRAMSLEAAFSTPFTLAPFGARELSAWFRSLQQASHGPSVVFRNSSDGSSLLPSAAGSEPEETGKETAAPHPFFEDLAAGSRGIAGVAWEIWRHSLRVARQQEVKEDAEKKAARDPNPTIWVTPWTEMKLPTVPAKLRQSHRFIFHALLIHGSLPEVELIRILPVASAYVQQAVQLLTAHGLLEQIAGEWRIRAVAYPAVRKSLAAEEFLLDAL